MSIYLRQVEFSVTNSEITADDLTPDGEKTRWGTVTLERLVPMRLDSWNPLLLMYAKGGTMLYSVTA